MKIIKQGKIKHQYDRIKHCSCCKTIFQYSQKDILGLTCDGQDIFDGVQCPVCEKLLRTSIFDRRVKTYADFSTRN